MHRSISLLERLDAAVRSPHGRTLVQDRAAVMRSILANLQRLLNSRQGAAPAQMDLGIPSPHELFQGFPASLDQAIKTIKACILQYEPRLTAVSVSHVPSESPSDGISFRITAQLAGDGPRETLSLTTAVSPTGRIRLAGS